MTETKSHDIVMIIDESGSMTMMENEVIQAINSFIQEQKSILNDNTTFSLWKFNNKITHMVDDILLKNVEKFTDFLPHGMTALMDAIGSAIDIKRSKNNYKDVICVILTDGLENSSQKYNKPNIVSMIQEMENYHNWKFVYLGANQDAFSVGSRYGVNINRCATFDFTPEQLSRTFLDTSNAIVNFRCASAYNSNADIELKLPTHSMSAPLTFPTICRTESLTDEVKVRRIIPFRQSSGGD